MSQQKMPRYTAPRSHGAPSPPGLASLPLTLADAIVSYAVGDEAFDFGSLPSDKQAIPKAVFPLAAVSKDWCAALDEVACSRALRSSTLKQSGVLTRSSMVSMRSHLTLRRWWTRRLTVMHSSLFPSEICEGYWAAALAHVPLRKDLKLCEPLSSSGDSQEQVVRAAASLCPLVETLVLPDYQYPPFTYHPNDGLMDNLLSTVFESASAWKRGLTRLRMSLEGHMEDADIARDYINCVIETCRKIQILDGYDASLSFHTLVHCREHWWLDLRTWKRFCRTCTELREFNWVCVPYATAFFEVFGRFLKPKLTKLALLTPAEWEWDPYIREMDARTKKELHASGYGPTAKNALAVLKASPALEELTVRWYHKVDIEVFGDEFVTALVNCCRRLTTVTLVHVNPVEFPVSTVRTFTDRSLRALNRLPQLAKVELSNCNITSAGLLSLLTGLSPDRCRFQLRLGESNDKPASLLFDHALINLLERLIKHEGPLRRRVSLHLINDKTHWLEERQCLATISTVQRLCQRAQAKHPVLRLHGLVTVVGERGEDFKRLREFIVVTDAAKPPQWNQVAFPIPDRSIDSVLVLRRLLHAEDSRDGCSN